MDLKVYYRKIRIVEAEIADADVVMISLETPDGGRAGVATEVRRRLAAKLVVEGKARLASQEEVAEHRKMLLEANRKAEELAAANRIKVAIVSDSELRSHRTPRSKK